MAYTEDNLKEINEKYAEINHIHDKLLRQLMSFQQRLKNEKAREYLKQGVGRRLKTLTRCINNIFTIFPADRVEHLLPEYLTDVTINLHAFFINIAGLFDNLGWVFVYENDLLGKTEDGKIDKKGVGLFNRRTQDHLKIELKNYLNSDPIKSWNEDYSKNYRDSLAHRIPLYVPPSVLNKSEENEFKDLEGQIQTLDFWNPADITKYDELCKRQEKLGKASLFFAHSLNEDSRPVYFHAQIIADYLTVEEIIYKFCGNF
jgi:hypothetical protein